MTMCARARVVILLCEALAVAACSAPDEIERDIPAVQWSGEYLDYAPQEGASGVCDGTLVYMDQYTGLVADAMGVELDRPVVYVHGSETEESFCSEHATHGCAFDDSVYSRFVPQEHEITHGVRGHRGFSHLFFEEGAAELFGDHAPLELRVEANGDLLEGIQSAHPDGGLGGWWYPRAGHFAAYLYDRFGSGVESTLIHETDAFSSAEHAIAMLERATGESFEELRAHYDQQPTCDQRRYRYPLYGCEHPEALRPRCDAQGEVLTIDEEISCEDSETVGPRDGALWKTVAVEVPSDGEYTLTALSDGTGDEDAKVVLEECSMRCDSIVHEKRYGLFGDTVFLRAGRYALRISQPAERPNRALVTLSGDCGQ